MSAQQGTASEVTTLLSTELDGLGDDTLSAAGSAVSLAGAIYANVLLTLGAQASARSAGAAVYLWLVPEVGDTYTDIVEECLGAPDAIFPLDAATNGRSVVQSLVSVPNTSVKAVVKNSTGQTLAASGNSVSIEYYKIEDAA